MGRTKQEDDGPLLPPRIKAAFEYLNHTRWVTEQSDATIPARELTPLERNVQAAALRTLQQYLLGEMDFAEEVPPAGKKKGGGDDDAAAEPVGVRD